MGQAQLHRPDINLLHVAEAMAQHCDGCKTDANSQRPRATGTAAPETAALFLPCSQMISSNPVDPGLLWVRPVCSFFNSFTLDSSLSDLLLIQTAASAISMTTTSVYTPFAPFMGSAAASPATPPRCTPGILTTLRCNNKPAINMVLSGINLS